MKMITLFICTLLCHNLFAQTKKEQVASLITERDTADMANLVRGRMKKNAYFKGKTTTIYYLFNFGYEKKMVKQDFLDGSFIGDLKAEHWKTRKGTFIRTHVLIKDSRQGVVAYGDNLLLTAPPADGSYQVPISADYKLFAELLETSKMDFIFYVYGSSISTYIGVKNNDLFAIDTSERGAVVYPLKDYIEQHWEDYASSLLLPDVNLPFKRTKKK